MKAFVQLAWLATAGGLLSICASLAAAQSVAADTNLLRVGVSPSFPPMVFKEGGKIVGVEADLAEALGRHLERRVVFVEEKWENLIDALCDNRIDIIMSSMSITPARSARIVFTRSYLGTGQLALVRGSEKYAYILNLAERAKHGVGVKRGTTAEFLVSQEFPKAKRKYFANGDDAAAALVKGKLDVYISDAPIIWRLAGLYEAKGLVVMPMVLSQEELGWGVRRDNTQLLDAANAFLQKVQASGDLKKTFSKWMPGFR